jgi:thiol-disulfide isomerase/thioredoxin
MKKGTMAAIAGFLIVLALFGYSYYSNKASTPPPFDKEAALSSTAPKEKETAGSSTTTDKIQESSDNNTVSNKPAVEEKVPRNAGEAIEQAKKNGESMWLLFRSTTCVPCVEMQKVFDKLESDYKGKVRFIAIDVNDGNNIDTLRTWRIQYIPTTFIVDGTGKVTYQNVGVIPTEDLKKELNKVVK